MAGDTVLGSMYWNLGLRGTLTQDVSSAKSEINGLDAATRKADGTFSIFEGVTSRNAREIRVMGAGVAAIGGALTLAGMEARNAGGDFETLGSMASTAGIAMTVLGGAATSIAPVMKAMAVAMNSELVASIKNFVSVAPAKVAALEADTVATIDATAATIALADAEIALNPSMVAAATGMEGAATAGKTLAGTNIYATTMTEALAAAGYSVNPSMIAMAEGEKTATAATLGLAASLRILGAATVIGAVVTGVYLLYEAFNASKQAAKELEDQIKSLSDQLEELRYEEIAVKYQLQSAESQYGRLTDKVKTYTDSIDKMNRKLERAKDIENELVDANLALEGATLDLSDAQAALNKFLSKGNDENEKWSKFNPKSTAKEDTDQERQRLEYNVKVAEQRQKEAQQTQAAKEKEKSEVPTMQALLALEASRARASLDAAEAEAKVLDLRKQEAAIETEEKKYDFWVKLLNWQEKGISISQKSRDLFSTVPWMREAMAMVPEFVTKQPDYLSAAAGIGMAGAPGQVPGLSAWRVPMDLSSMTYQNPVFRGTTPAWVGESQKAASASAQVGKSLTTGTVDNSFHVEKIEVKNGQTTGQVVSDLFTLQEQRIRRGARG